MSKYLIYENKKLKSDKPATHAIVIGVGEYNYLSGGKSGRVTPINGGLKQLTSPPISAKVFTKWLLDKFNNPDKPLATISMLISEKNGPVEFNHRSISITPEEATINNAIDAIRDWKNYGDLNEENLLLFFFCGHGVSKGLEGLTLLLADYGKTDNMPMEGAVDFSALHRGMGQCKAIEQCFFIDTCRKADDLASKTTYSGHPIIQDYQNRPFNSRWKSAIFYSTLAGESAFGRKNRPSYFTEELIKGLNGTGSNRIKADEKWRISTGNLNTAIHLGLALRGEKINVPMTSHSYFEFHELKKNPIVRAIVFCDPRSDNKKATFFCKQDNKNIRRRKPNIKNWEVNIPVGHYDFIAKIGTRKGVKPDIMIIPPHQEIEIEVK